MEVCASCWPNTIALKNAKKENSIIVRIMAEFLNILGKDPVIFYWYLQCKNTYLRVRDWGAYLASARSSRCCKDVPHTLHSPNGYRPLHEYPDIELYFENTRFRLRYPHSVK